MTKEAIHSDDAPSAIGTYSQAIKTNGMVFMSGQIPLDPATMEIVAGDFEARARQVFENLKAVAEATEQHQEENAAYTETLARGRPQTKKRKDISVKGCRSLHP